MTTLLPSTELLLTQLQTLINLATVSSVKASTNDNNGSYGGRFVHSLNNTPCGHLIQGVAGGIAMVASALLTVSLTITAIYIGLFSLATIATGTPIGIVGLGVAVLLLLGASGGANATIACCEFSINHFAEMQNQ